MEDQKIVALYWAREETAIRETAAKYGSYCHSIAYGILQDKQDAEESVNDTWLNAWEAMPPHRPSALSAFLGKITRRISIDRWREKNRLKRGGGEVILALEELEECIAGSRDVTQELEKKELTQAVNRFLDTLPAVERRVFLGRYWYLEPVRELADKYRFSQSKVLSMLHRTRGKLRRQLEKEGFV